MHICVCICVQLDGSFKSEYFYVTLFCSSKSRTQSRFSHFIWLFCLFSLLYSRILFLPLFFSFCRNWLCEEMSPIGFFIFSPSPSPSLLLLFLLLPLLLLFQFLLLLLFLLPLIWEISNILLMWEKHSNPPPCTHCLATHVQACLPYTPNHPFPFSLTPVLFSHKSQPSHFLLQYFSTYI